MEFVFTSEQEDLRRTVRRFGERTFMEDGILEPGRSESHYDHVTWSTMVGQLGLSAVSVPIEYGGAGAGLVELGIVFEELGAFLVRSPYFASVALGVNTLLSCADEVSKNRYLPLIAAGGRTATLAFAEDSGDWSPHAACRTRADRVDGQWLLCGAKSFVVDGATADLTLVTARAEEGLGLFAVDSDASGVVRSPLETLDLTRPQARVEFTNVPAQPVAVGAGVAEGLELALATAAVCLSAEAVGGARACLDASVGYAKSRYQFGRPIGSFQAIKHRCADMLIAVESARSAAYHSMWSEHDPAELCTAASIAKASCADSYFFVAAQNLQLHGGIGFTWEHPAHLYLRRAKSVQAMLGSGTYHRRLLARRLGFRPCEVSGEAMATVAEG